MTLICLALQLLGPMRERSLTIVLLMAQGLCSAIGLWARSHLARTLFYVAAAEVGV
jgi:hypothetical protein